MVPRTTPHRLRLLAVLLVTAVLLVAAASWTRVVRAGEDADRLRERRLPAVLALEQVAEALTAADRAAVGQLASGSFPLTGPGTDYQDAVKTAGQALADARERLDGSDRTLAQLRAVDGLIIEFTSLVGMAQSGGEGPRAVAGIAYASDLLHAPDTGILARVGQLRESELAAIRETRDDYWTSPTAMAPLAVSAAAGLVLVVTTLWYLRRRFRRHINPPLVLVLVGLLVLSAWDLSNAARTRERIDTAAGPGVTRLAELWQARTAVQRVVGAESLALVTRGVGVDHRAAADAALRELAYPAGPEATVRAKAAEMAGIVGELRGRGFGPEPDGTDHTPQDQRSVDLVIGGDSGTLTAVAEDADNDIADAIAETRRDTERRLATASDDQGLAVGGPLLCLGMLVAGLWGLWRRWDEYRTGG
ncbi:hypothetical protein [Yinghuangia sp. YIM S09857]|uniref:hypothetical protein n=1 Tax=Yinghuangia sp. YIM S09857 TaxID=3436929 RepID=UPI003F530711